MFQLFAAKMNCS